MTLPGKFKLSERDSAPIVGYWMFSKQEEKNPTLRQLRQAYDAAITSAEGHRNRLENFKSDSSLSAKGIKDKATAYVRDQIPQLMKAKVRATGAVRRDLASRVVKMEPVKIDRGDTFAEMQRREIRDVLRSMPMDDRIKLIHQGDDAVVEAILGAPAVLTSMVPPSVIETARDTRMEKLYSQELGELRELQDAVKLVEKAYEGVLAELQLDSGMTKSEIDQIAKPALIDAINEFKVKNGS